MARYWLRLVTVLVMLLESGEIVEQSGRVSRCMMGVLLNEVGELQSKHMGEDGGKQEPQYMRLVCNHWNIGSRWHLSQIPGLP